MADARIQFVSKTKILSRICFQQILSLHNNTNNFALIVGISCTEKFIKKMPYGAGEICLSREWISQLITFCLRTYYPVPRIKVTLLYKNKLLHYLQKIKSSNYCLREKSYVTREIILFFFFAMY